MRVLSVVGNRPQFIKSGPLSVALRERGIDEVVVHTGQHYDRELSQVFFEELELTAPRYTLDLKTADPALMEPPIAMVVGDEQPDWVLVYGDTNSTLAGARAAGETSVAHVEAGLRSGDLTMPEEHNRIEVDRIASLLLCPDERSRELLQAEGVSGRVEVVGDVMADANFKLAPIARERSPILAALELEPGDYAVVTVHREANVQPERLARIFEGLSRIEDPVVFPAHPRTAAVATSEGLSLGARPNDPAARVSRLRRAGLAGARDPHRLGRPAEGGVLVRRPVRDTAAVDGVEGHGRGRSERSCRRRSRRNRAGGGRRANARRTATAVRRRARCGTDRRRSD